MFSFLLKALGFVVLLSAITLNVNAHTSYGKGSNAYKSVKLTPNIYMLQGKGGNIVLFKGKDGLLLIDDDYKELSTDLKNEIVHHGKVDELKYLINTHWHGDHTGGNFALGKYTTIISHDNVRKRLQTTQEIKLFNKVSKPYPDDALPTLTYNDTLKIYFNNEEIKVMHYAYGHTDGDSVVFFKKSNIVHMGDLYFSGSFPFVDVGSGGDVLQMAKNIKMVLNKIDDSTKVVAGHGRWTSKKDLNKYYWMLVGTYNEINLMYLNDFPSEKIKQIGLSDKWNNWGGGFITKDIWVDIIYESILKNNPK